MPLGGCAPRVWLPAYLCWRRLRRWEQDGTWEKIWRSLLSLLDEQGKIGWDKVFLEAAPIGG
jgi:transposase